MKFTGTKYEATRDFDIAQIAELVRADIKAATKAGELPAGLKLSVRISRYSMGQSLRVEITAAPFEVRVSREQEDDNRAEGFKFPWLTREAAAVLDTLNAIRSAYNFDNSDPMTDYYHVRFGGSVDYRIKAAKPAAPVARVLAPAPRMAPVAAPVTEHTAIAFHSICDFGGGMTVAVA